MTIYLLTEPRTEIVPTLRLPDGLHVVWLHALPIYEQERDFRATHGTDALMAAFERQRIPFWSQSREPLATPGGEHGNG